MWDRLLRQRATRTVVAVCVGWQRFAQRFALGRIFEWQSGVVNHGLVQHWLEVAVAGHDPDEGPGVRSGGPSVGAADERLRVGLDVRGVDEDDRRTFIEQQVLERTPLPTLSRAIGGGVSTLGQHALLNMNRAIDAGIWLLR